MDALHASYALAGQKGAAETISGAEAMLDGLIACGVEKVFGDPGGTHLPLADALSRRPALEYILGPDEQGAIHAAQEYSRRTGKPGVLIVAPGAGGADVTRSIQEAAFLVICTGRRFSSTATTYSLETQRRGEVLELIRQAMSRVGIGRAGPVVVTATESFQLLRLPCL